MIEARLGNRAGRIGLRQSLGIGADDVVVMAAMKFIPREDPLTALRAHAAIVRRIPSVHLLLAGDGELRAVLEATVAADRIPNVHLPGYLSYGRLIDHFAAADVFVHPACQESWGVSVNEALVCGLPVVAADTVGSAADLLIPDGVGYTFPAGDAAALADRLTRLVSDPHLRAELGRRGPARAAEWGYDRTVAELRKAVAAVATRGRAVGS
jgi:glycosyltransferase involved in cell wall biosynthesis